MVPEDEEYIGQLLADGVIKGPVLELGTGYSGATCKAAIEKAGLQHFGTDMETGKGVDFAADFEKISDLNVFNAVIPFGSILILNVLEHTFDPIRILDNALTLVKNGGNLVVLTPSVWPLHNYPMDAWRILPNFYEEYAKRRNLKMAEEYFVYPGRGPVKSFRNKDSSYAYPLPGGNGLRRNYGRIVHKVFNTFGRSMSQPNFISVATVFAKS